MRISHQVHGTGQDPDRTTPVQGAPRPSSADDWSQQTRRVLTRDLLTRASRAGFGESQALRFRALHLNLPLVAEVADRLELTDAERTRSEAAALDGLQEAVRLYDPTGDAEFAEFATPFVEWQIRLHVRRGVLARRWRKRPAARAVSRRKGRSTRR
jgi:DNA-directed RNA polymerase specialized sigma subunit